MLWVAMLVSGRATPAQVWRPSRPRWCSGAFRSWWGSGRFSSGMQANGLGSLLTLGLPLVAAAAARTGAPALAASCRRERCTRRWRDRRTFAWLPGPLLTGLATVWLARRMIGRCEGHFGHGSTATKERSRRRRSLWHGERCRVSDPFSLDRAAYAAPLAVAAASTRANRRGTTLPSWFTVSRNIAADAPTSRCRCRAAGRRQSAREFRCEWRRRGLRTRRP